jgi:benzoyl-CoA reductase/2-hydroxyglutaryl-CoA dehydratase subunit BcrC/BadD/HgdB
MAALADCYFTRRVSPAWFRPAVERREFIIKLAKDFKVNGVIWYHLMFRESYKTESYYFPDLLRKETGLPMLVVESDYDPAGVQDMEAHIDVFMHTLRR